ncbi:MAG: hypothetical protein ACR2L2_08345 [Acidobacteriota bacterium]
MRAVAVCAVWVAVIAGILAGADASFQIQGFVYCLDEKGAPTVGPEGEPCAAQGHRYALNTLEGKLYPLVRGDVGESLFVDRRLHERTLLLTLLASRTAGAFEVLAVQSVVSGVVHNVYYFCDVCNIRDFAPGPCDCCRQPYQFIEQPARSSDQ